MFCIRNIMVERREIKYVYHGVFKNVISSDARDSLNLLIYLRNARLAPEEKS